MRIYEVKSIQRQDDWRFYDIVLNVFNGSTARSTCCSYCMITDKKPVKEVRVILSYRFLEDILDKGIELKKRLN